MDHSKKQTLLAKYILILNLIFLLNCKHVDKRKTSDPYMKIKDIEADGVRRMLHLDVFI